MSGSSERPENVTFGMNIVRTLVTAFFGVCDLVCRPYSCRAECPDCPRSGRFTNQSHCHDELARDLIREKGELSKKDAGEVSDICTARTAGEDFLRQLDAATGASG